MAAKPVHQLASELLERLAERGERLALAESCTGGAIAAALTEVPGASRAFDRALVTYADQAKIDELGVSATLIQQHGAVSAPVAEAMAQGARSAAAVDWAIGVTGIAGPTGGSEDKPVGTVHIAIAGHQGARSHRYRFEGDRAAIREASVHQAIEDALACLEAA